MLDESALSQDKIRRLPLTESNLSRHGVSEKGWVRRDMLARTAALFGAGHLFLSASDAQNPSPDLALLNYALSLENLEAAFYGQGLKRFASTDFDNAGFMQNLGTVIGQDVYAYLSLIRDHEAAHVRRYGR